jgi:transposase
MLAQEQERLELGQRERDRLKVLHEVESGHLKQREAAAQLGLSERGFRKLLKRYRAKGDRAVVHGLRGRASNRRIEAKVARAAVRLVKKEYSDFGPTLASEYLEQEHGIELSRETLRKLLTAAGQWEPKQRSVKQVHVWRARRSCRGELVQWDTSVHAWLEERGPEKMYLIALIDDATNTLFARFVEADSSEQHRRVLWAYLERYGRPQAVYTDRASVFQPTLAPGWREEEPGPRTETQMGRALRELGIEWIAARSPQAKGRVERCFGTLQDRLVKALRKAGVNTLEGANAYLEAEFLPMWNQRFVRSPASAVDAHRSLQGTDLASVLSCAEQRQVANDYTISWKGERWQISKKSIRPGLRRSSVRVEQRLDGTMMAWIGGEAVRLERCEERRKEPAAKAKRPAKRFIPPPGQSGWMDGFRVEGNPAWKAWREEQTRAVSARLRSPSGLPSPG